VFVVSLLVGATGVYVGARVATGARGFGRAVVTALVGSVVWSVVGFLLGWVPLLGPVLALVAYVGVVNWRYPGGWLTAAVVAGVAVAASFVVLAALGTLGLVGVDALGVPGV
jgi:hypothetical protein